MDELVGRDASMAGLKENLMEKPVNSVAAASMHGAGSMGKTFLAPVFVAEHREEVLFLEIHLGERSPFEAGIELLDRLVVDTREINTPGKLQSALRRLYSESGGTLILDDVREEAARILLPESLKWRVLITTRSESPGKSLKLKVRRLDALESPESMALFRKIQGKNFYPRWTRKIECQANEVYYGITCSRRLGRAPDDRDGVFVTSTRPSKPWRFNYPKAKPNTRPGARDAANVGFVNYSAYFGYQPRLTSFI